MSLHSNSSVEQTRLHLSPQFKGRILFGAVVYCALSCNYPAMTYHGVLRVEKLDHQAFMRISPKSFDSSVSEIGEIRRV